MTIKGYGRLALAATIALAGCSKPADTKASGAETPTIATATPASGTPAAANVDTADGTKLAFFTGDAAQGEAAFAVCKACHQLDQNGIGPQLHGVVGRKAGIIPGFTYSDTAKGSGITWTPEKLFQFLENPRRVIPMTRMTFAGVSDAQKRADIIAYLKAN